MNVQLANEKTEVRLLKSQLDSANKQLASLHSDLSETRATAWKRKEEIEALNAQMTTEKAEVKSLRATINYKDKNTKDLEDQIDDLRKIHWNKEKEAESARRDLERKNFQQYEETEKLRRSLVETEAKAKDPEKLRRAHEDLERVYASLQHQYQASENIFILNILKLFKFYSQIKEDELERTMVELEEYRSKLNNYDSGYFPNCKVKTLFH